LGYVYIRLHLRLFGLRYVGCCCYGWLQFTLRYGLRCYVRLLRLLLVGWLVTFAVTFYTFTFTLLRCCYTFGWLVAVVTRLHTLVGLLRLVGSVTHTFGWFTFTVYVVTHTRLRLVVGWLLHGYVHTHTRLLHVLVTVDLRLVGYTFPFTHGLRLRLVTFTLVGSVYAFTRWLGYVYGSHVYGYTRFVCTVTFTVVYGLVYVAFTLFGCCCVYVYGWLVTVTLLFGYVSWLRCGLIYVGYLVTLLPVGCLRWLGYVYVWLLRLLLRVVTFGCYVCCCLRCCWLFTFTFVVTFGLFAHTRLHGCLRLFCGLVVTFTGCGYVGCTFTFTVGWLLHVYGLRLVGLPTFYRLVWLPLVTLVGCLRLRLLTFCYGSLVGWLRLRCWLLVAFAVTFWFTVYTHARLRILRLRLVGLRYGCWVTHTFCVWLVVTYTRTVTVGYTFTITVALVGYVYVYGYVGYTRLRLRLFTFGLVALVAFVGLRWYFAVVWLRLVVARLRLRLVTGCVYVYGYVWLVTFDWLLVDYVVWLRLPFTRLRLVTFTFAFGCVLHLLLHGLRYGCTRLRFTRCLHVTLFTFTLPTFTVGCLVGYVWLLLHTVTVYTRYGCWLVGWFTFTVYVLRFTVCYVYVCYVGWFGYVCVWLVGYTLHLRLVTFWLHTLLHTLVTFYVARLRFTFTFYVWLRCYVWLFGCWLFGWLRCFVTLVGCYVAVGWLRYTFTHTFTHTFTFYRLVGYHTFVTLRLLRLVGYVYVYVTLRLLHFHGSFTLLRCLHVTVGWLFGWLVVVVWLVLVYSRSVGYGWLRLYVYGCTVARLVAHILFGCLRLRLHGYTFTLYVYVYTRCYTFVWLRLRLRFTVVGYGWFTLRYVWLHFGYVVTRFGLRTVIYRLHCYRFVGLHTLLHTHTHVGYGYCWLRFTFGFTHVAVTVTFTIARLRLVTLHTRLRCVYGCYGWVTHVWLFAVWLLVVTFGWLRLLHVVVVGCVRFTFVYFILRLIYVTFGLVLRFC